MILESHVHVEAVCPVGESHPKSGRYTQQGDWPKQKGNARPVKGNQGRPSGTLQSMQLFVRKGQFHASLLIKKKETNGLSAEIQPTFSSLKPLHRGNFKFILQDEGHVG